MSQNSLFMLVTGDFNIQSSSLWENYLITSESSQVDAVASAYDLSQLICEPTHIFPNSSLYIHLIFINQSNFILDSSVHASLHPNFHHQLVNAKLNLKIEYP